MLRIKNIKARKKVIHNNGVIIKKIFLVILVVILLLFIFLKFRLDLYVSNKQAWNILIGEKYYNNNNYEKSLESANKALRINQSNVEANKLKISTMISDLMKFTDTNKSNVEMVYNHLSVYKDRNKDSESLEFYYFSLGKLKYFEGSLSESIYDFEKAYFLNQDSQYIPRWLGIAYLKKHDLEKSMYYFNKAINNPKKDRDTDNIFGSKIELGISHAGKGYVFLEINKTKYHRDAENEFKQSLSLCGDCRKIVEIIIYSRMI